MFAAMLGIASIPASKTGGLYLFLRIYFAYLHPVPTTGVYEDGWNASIMYGLLMFYELCT
jgi:hypothetical protein